MKTTRVKHLKTGVEYTAIYAPDFKGDMRYHINGKPIPDKLFDRQYSIVPESKATLAILAINETFKCNPHILEAIREYDPNLEDIIQEAIYDVISAAGVPYDKYLTSKSKIEWQRGELAEQHDHYTIYAAYGESPDGKKWIGSWGECNGQFDEVTEIEEA